MPDKDYLTLFRPSPRMIGLHLADLADVEMFGACQSEPRCEVIAFRSTSTSPQVAQPRQRTDGKQL
jgi:hypothetical protein